MMLTYTVCAMLECVALCLQIDTEAVWEAEM